MIQGVDGVVSHPIMSFIALKFLAKASFNLIGAQIINFFLGHSPDTPVVANPLQILLSDEAAPWL